MAQKKRITEDISYLQAIEEIEKIVAELSSGKTDIDALPSKVKRGAELIAGCKSKLRETEESINKVFNEE